MNHSLWSIVYGSWLTKHCLRVTVSESWFTKHSLRVIVYESWCTNHSLRVMVTEAEINPIKSPYTAESKYIIHLTFSEHESLYSCFIKFLNTYVHIYIYTVYIYIIVPSHILSIQFVVVDPPLLSFRTWPPLQLWGDFIRQGGEEEPEGYEALKQTYSMWSPKVVGT